MWTKIYGPIEFPRVWQTGDNAFVETLEEHLQKVKPVIDEPWDLVFADELFAVSSYALAMRAQQRGKPFMTLSTCIPTNLLKYHLTLGTSVFGAANKHIMFPQSATARTVKVCLALLRQLQLTWEGAVYLQISLPARIYVLEGTPFALRPSMYHRNSVPYLIETFANRLHAVIQETWVAIRVQYVTAYNAVQEYGSFKPSASKALPVVTLDLGLNKIGIVDFDFSKLAKLSAYTFLDDVNSLVFPSPVGTEIVEVGFHCPRKEELSQEYLDFVNDPRSSGTILIAFGSNVIWDYASDELMERMVVALNRLREYSLKDTICGGVPVVYIPLFAEQSHNGEVARTAGFAETLSKTQLTSDLVERTVRRVAGQLRPHFFCFSPKNPQKALKENT
ncbi:hypothetical protein ANCDUO_22869 [Ancylostoma duodenale]|uniref:glucuronosyltransferase n=1 Tax=Ancylostoma duodenale TaxID=51022 RepID=A0A0C2FES2_9BILA|nr:hypothetical protein ANCDUO_22869 [Ancylostoma duodenale]